MNPTMLFAIVIIKTLHRSGIYTLMHTFLRGYSCEVVNVLVTGGEGHAVTVGIEIVTGVTTSAADVSVGTVVMMKGVHQIGDEPEETQAMMNGAHMTGDGEG